MKPSLTGIWSLSRRNSWVLVLVGIVFLCLILACLQLMRNQWLVVTRAAQSGSLVEAVPAWGIVVGAERVYYAQYSGKVIPLVGDGQRVPARGVVCEIVDESRLATARLQQSNPSLGIGAAEENVKQRIADLELAVEAAEQALREAVIAGDEQRIRLREKDLVSLHEELQKVRTMSRGDDVVSHLALDPGGYSQIVRAPMAGVIRFAGDGYEELSIDMFRGLTREGVKAMRRQNWQVKDGQVVGIGTPLFRLDLGHELWCYLVLDADAVVSLEPKDEIVLRIPGLGGRSYVGVIENVDANEVQVSVVVRFANYAAELLEWRSGSVELVNNMYTGVVIPKSALVERSGALGVYLQEDNGHTFTLVRKIGEVGGEVVVSGIPVGAQVVTNPRMVMGESWMRLN